MTVRCFSCGDEFLDNGWADLCPGCEQIERADMEAAADDWYPLTRTEQMRERLGVSGDVDE